MDVAKIVRSARNKEIEQIKGMNRKQRRHIAKLNKLPMLSGTQEPYIKPIKN